MTKSKELQNLINDLHAFRISSPTTFYHPPILDDAAQVIENLLQELEEERHRHDRLQDWTVARDEEREKLYPELGREVFFVLDDPDEEIGKRWKVEEGMRVVAVAENRIGVSDIEDPESISFFWYDPFDKTEEAFHSKHAAEIRAEELNRKDLETLDFLKKEREKDNAEL